MDVQTEEIKKENMLEKCVHILYISKYDCDTAKMKQIFEDDAYKKTNRGPRTPYQGINPPAGILNYMERLQIPFAKSRKYIFD